MPLPAFRRRRTAWTFAVACALASGTGCEPNISAPRVAPDARQSLRAQAFVLAVNLRTGEVSVSSPTSGAITRSAIDGQPGASISFPKMQSVSTSLLGTGLVELRASNFSAGAIGAVQAGKLRVLLDLTVVNLLNVSLITPTFPVPPSGVTGLQAFPFEILVSTAPGGPLVVSPPIVGPVQASLDWSGAPHNFLNDVQCGQPASDCFRYEPFAEIAPFGISEPRTVGFLIDPNVVEFRVAMLLAADLRATPTP